MVDEFTTDDPEGVNSLEGAEPSQDDPNASPDSEIEDEALGAEHDVEAEKQPSRAQQRIQQLVGDKKAAMEYGDFWKSKFEEMSKGQPQAKEPEAPPQAPKMPKLEDFDYDTDAYSAAVLDHAQFVARQAAEESARKVWEKNQQEQSQQALDMTWQQKAAAFTETHEDFMETISNPMVPITKEMAEVIKTADLGPNLAYHLGKNPQEAKRIASLPASRQAYEMGRVEASLATVAVKQKQVTKAPEPINPVGSGKSSGSIPKNESMDDYIKRRRAERAAKRGR